ncbi:MAG: methylmalonate-semialdehyde dehydrogenase (CoA acylating) [Zetaproteobacteria bacterium]|nr:methylmalonate-semialdehyde dehydrogenase (CoA acylating) [Pseudobdellovibrionaceae bacterium]
MAKKVGHWINGKHVDGQSDTISPWYNPATGDVTGHLSLANRSETEHAIDVASDSLQEWSATPPLARARILFRFIQKLEQHKDEIARLITEEHGKVFSDAKGELVRGIEVVEFATGIPHLLKGEFSNNVGKNIDSWSVRQPLGVCAGITPFNFPAMVPMWMFPIALACGNTFILKPSERDPSASMMMAELLSESGLPDGVFNVVNGDRNAVDTILESPKVDGISFVGSTPIAESVYLNAAKYGKRCQALGGAKNHMVIMPDADMDMAVKSLMGAAYGSAGERCMAISVAVAVGAAAEPLIQKLVPLVNKLRVGPGLGAEPENEMGPLVTGAHKDRVAGYIERGAKEGAKLLVDGRKSPCFEEEGFFIGGSLFDHVTADMDIYKDEIFGPVLCVVRVPDFQSAVALVNGHEYGNGTAIFTRNGNYARQYSEQIEVGMVGINVPIPVPMAFYSFGGWKRSLFGSLHVHGMEGVKFYTRTKTMTGRWPEGYGSGNEFSMPTLG